LSGHITFENVSKEFKELFASADEVIMQQHSQLSKEKLVGIQDNHDTVLDLSGSFVILKTNLN
jgi:ElaB/YqjD/DUF883 family membrane-anchored ribosome-binding protein